MRLKSFSLSYGAQVFKAFSDESRIRILFQLFNNNEMCISDLEQVLNFTQTKTSRHLLYLKNSGIVTSRKFDQWVFYSIKDEAVDLITQIFAYLKNDQNLAEDLNTFNTLHSNRELAINRLEGKKWMS